MRIGEIASSAEYRMDEHCKICQFLKSNFGFSNWKKFYKFVNFPNYKILVLQIENFQKFVNLPIWKILEIYEFSKLQNFGFAN